MPNTLSRRRRRSGETALAASTASARAGYRPDSSALGRSLAALGSVLLPIAPLAVSAALTVLLYGASISYGFMFDDPLDLPRASGRSYLEIVTARVGDSPYYRPLVLVVWKALYDLLGRHDAPTLHLLVLAAHALNGWLVYSLGARLQGRLGGCVSALLFVAFPLSYQSVEMVNSFFHPLVTLFLLLAVVLYLRWRESGRVGWLLAAGAAAVLGAFTHEYGVVVVALVVAAEAWWARSRGRRRPSLAPAAFAAISAGFLLVWWAAPKWEHRWQLDPASLKLNSLYFFQGLVYPVASQLADWPGLPALAPAWKLLLLGSPVVALMVVLHLLSRRAPSFGFALAWAAVGVLPAIVSLPFSYVVDGPRLFYLASVGIALAWGGALSAPLAWHGRAPRALFGGAGLILAGLILAQSALFVQARDALFVEGAKAVRTLAATATDPERPGRTYVNFPSWLALRRPDYLFGHTGVVMVPSYVGLGRVAYLQTGEQPEIASLAYDAVARQWDHAYATHGGKAGLDELERAFRRGGGVYATDFSPGSLGIEYVGAIVSQGADVQASPYVARLEGWGRLVSGRARLERGAVDLTLRWGALGPADRDYTVFAHVYDAAGRLVAQADGYPIGGAFPPARWRPGDVVEDRRQIALPAAVGPGAYRVVVGLYDRQTGQRARALDASGARYEDDGVPVASLPSLAAARR